MANIDSKRRNGVVIDTKAQRKRVVAVKIAAFFLIATLIHVCLSGGGEFQLFYERPSRTTGTNVEYSQKTTIHGTSTSEEYPLVSNSEAGQLDSSKILDWAVVGFGKCGTTNLGRWLSRHPQTRAPSGELYALRANLERFKTVMRNQRLKPSTQNEIQDGMESKVYPLSEIKVGYRCPSEVQLPGVMRRMKDNFPDAKLIVSVRHPVTWFESFYNYHVDQGEFPLIRRSPLDMIGRISNSVHVQSTEHSASHMYLARMAKTSMEDPEERGLLQAKGFLPLFDSPKAKLNPIPNKVFLLETTQMNDSDETRLDALRQDLHDFLELDAEVPLPPIPHIRPNENKKPRYVNANFTRIDICDDEFIPVREELMNIARNASLWYRRYFLQSPDVVVTSREHLVKDIFEASWMKDPCDLRGSVRGAGSAMSQK